ELPVELLRQQLDEFVLESLAFVVGQWQVARIGADPQDVRVDELKAGIKARVLGMRRAHRDGKCRRAGQCADQRNATEDSRRTEFGWSKIIAPRSWLSPLAVEVTLVVARFTHRMRPQRSDHKGRPHSNSLPHRRR